MHTGSLDERSVSRSWRVVEAEREPVGIGQEGLDHAVYQPGGDGIGPMPAADTAV
jgi:hypothetical protein